MEGVNGKMIATIEKKYMTKGIAAPRLITSERQYEEYVSTLLELERQSGLSAAAENFAELLTLLIESYEEKHYAVPDASPVRVLRELISANNLRQKDLADLLGSESVVSEILSGKRELNKRQIEKLSKRFKISPAVFSNCLSNLR
jgi:HTH-type transcriptional regulator / antitoxin HigA